MELVSIGHFTFFIFILSLFLMVIVDVYCIEVFRMILSGERFRCA